MIRGKLIYLRLFEPSDYELTYQWHSDAELQEMTCGPIRVVSKEIEKAWVLSKATNNRNDIYLAICAVDTDEMIGYASLNNINQHFQSCSFGGIVIGNKNYRTGEECFEACILMLQYAFEELNINRITGACLFNHTFTRSLLSSLYFKEEGYSRQAVYKKGKFIDRREFGLLRSDFLPHLLNGELAIPDVAVRFIQEMKRIKKEEKQLK